MQAEPKASFYNVLKSTNELCKLKMFSFLLEYIMPVSL